MTLLLMALTITAPSGWKATGQLEVHDTHAKIYAAINGAADLYFSYGLEELQVREYTRDKVEVEVEIYELGEPLDGFGVLHRERPRNSTSAGVGAESAVTAQMCIARHGRFYLKAKAFRGQLTAASCKELLTPMTSALESAADPPELGLLPMDGRIDGAVGYARERYLGLSALTRCVYAEYESRSRKHSVFVMVRGDWNSLASWEAVTDQPSPTLLREVPYTGWVAVARTKTGIIIGVVSEGKMTTVTLLRRVSATLPQ